MGPSTHSAGTILAGAAKVSSAANNCGGEFLTIRFGLTEVSWGPVTAHKAALTVPFFSPGTRELFVNTYLPFQTETPRGWEPRLSWSPLDSQDLVQCLECDSLCNHF